MFLVESIGMHLARSAIRSVLAGTAASRSVRLAAAADDDDRNNDDVDRLTFSQAEAGAAYPAVPDFVVDESDHAIEMQDVAHTAQVLFANDDVSDRAAVSGVHSSHKQSRRRRYVRYFVYLKHVHFGNHASIFFNHSMSIAVGAW